MNDSHLDGFKDHFSETAAGYASYRPRYPAALFDWLAEQAPGKSQVWDAGTGNGQAAADLAERFERVVATDASADQIAHAAPHPKVTYQVSPAEESSLPASSFDLVTAAQALHWFHIPAFFAEARRVLVPGGVIAAWTYVSPEVDDALLDNVLQSFAELVKPFWPPERAIVESGYRTVAFPFEEIEAPHFEMEHAATREALAGYLRTWSATQRYMQASGTDPVIDLERRLAEIWPAGETRQLLWEMNLRAGRKKGDGVIG